MLQVYNTLADKEEPFTATITANGQIMNVAQMIVIANSKKYGTRLLLILWE
jgi:hypothetical protein